MGREGVFTHDVLPRIRAGHPVLSIITHEWERVQNDLIDSSEELGRRLLSWSSANRSIQELVEDEDGIQEWVDLTIGGEPVPVQFDDVWTSNIPADGPDWMSGRVGRCAPDYLLWWYKNNPDLHETILWMRDITPYLDSASHGASSHERRALVRRIRDFCQKTKHVESKTVVMTFPESYLPVELEKDVEQFTLPLPNEELLDKLLDLELKNWNADNPAEKVEPPEGEVKKSIVKAALGLTLQEASSAYRQICARMKMQAKPRSSMVEEDISVLNEQKAQIINKTGVLEFIPHRESVDDIGGMRNLKEWLEIHKGSLDDEVDPPKGLLMMGVPGCGKSLMARAVASDWGLPLLQLKASNIFDKYVGESEGKITRALAIAEACSPCVLWIDELEKLLAGSGGDGSLDSGVAARMGGMILSWLADKDSPVFVVATANNPERLDPAYVRRGRFDERFFVDLPGDFVRKEIFSKKIASRFPDIDIESLDMENLVKLSPGFTGAEIEQCIKEAKNISRYNGLSDLDGETLLRVVEEMVPDAIAMTDTIQEIRTLWGGDRARQADSDEPVDLDQPRLKDDDLRRAVKEQRNSVRRF